MRRRLLGSILFLSAAFLAPGCGNSGNGTIQPLSPFFPFSTPTPAPVSQEPSRSGTIQIDPTNSLVYMVNKKSGISTNGQGSLSVMSVSGGTPTKSFEVVVGNDPQSVSVSPDGTRAYVSLGADNAVAVVDLTGGGSLIKTIPVGSEPRGTALSPTGAKLYVANFSDGTVSVIDTAGMTVTNTIALTASGGVTPQPWAVVVTNDGSRVDGNQTIFVSDFFARARAAGSPTHGGLVEGTDDGKEGHVAVISASSETQTGQVALEPMASGFKADRTAFTPSSTVTPANSTYAVTTNTTAVPQNLFFNQLGAMEIDPSTNRLYLPAIGAQPEPPFKFNVNVQAPIGVINTGTLTEATSEEVNLNNLIQIENGGVAPAAPFTTANQFTRLFMADTVDMSIRHGTVVFLSRAGSLLLVASRNSSNVITLNNSASTDAVRVATGSIPNGVVLSSDGLNAYVNSEVAEQLTVVNLPTQVATNVQASQLPNVGTTAHNALIGKLVFFTGLGTPISDLKNTDVRNISTIQFRNAASKDNWSSCASCHSGGREDHVTWIFDTGPRRTLSLDATFDHNLLHQRVLNWNATRSSVTDFNQNSIKVQGGTGFAPDATAVFNHGPGTTLGQEQSTTSSGGVSDPLDLETLWVRVGIRTLNAPSTLDPAAVSRGRADFIALSCNNCHGGDQWTSSRVNWNPPSGPSTNTLPLFNTDPTVQNPLPMLQDPLVKTLAAPAQTVVTAFDIDLNGTFADPIITQAGTLDLTNPIEIRGGGGNIGKASVGAGGSFNPPSLLGLGNNGPYGHHGLAKTISQVFQPIVAGSGDAAGSTGGLGHPTFGATSAQLADIAVFLQSIDSHTQTLTQPFP